MSFYPLLGKLHGGASLVLFLLAMTSVVISVLIAVKPAADQANDALRRKANFVGLIELIVAVIITVTGGIAVYLGSWSISDLWLWMSLMIMAFYCFALIFVTKPARMAVSDGGSAVKTGMQVILHIGHVLLIFVAYALMLLKPV